MKERAKQTAIRFTEAERAMLAALAEAMGVNQTSVIKIAIRDRAKLEGIPIEPPRIPLTKDDEDGNV